MKIIHKELIMNYSSKALSYDYVKKQLEIYVQEKSWQTFGGFLLFAGISTGRFNNLKALYENDNRDAIKIMKLLEWFKSALEVRMEEWMIYQTLHPDLDGKYFNLKQLEWIMKKSNPEKYGDEVKTEKEKRVKEKTYVFKNVSGNHID